MIRATRIVRQPRALRTRRSSPWRAYGTGSTNYSAIPTGRKLADSIRPIRPFARAVHPAAERLGRPRQVFGEEVLQALTSDSLSFPVGVLASYFTCFRQCFERIAAASRLSFRPIFLLRGSLNQQDFQFVERIVGLVCDLPPVPFRTPTAENSAGTRGGGQSQLGSPVVLKPPRVGMGRVERGPPPQAVQQARKLFFRCRHWLLVRASVLRAIYPSFQRLDGLQDHVAVIRASGVEPIIEVANWNGRHG